MTQTDLKKEMIRYVNGGMFITLKELTLFLGYSGQSTKEVKGKFITPDVGKVGKMYFIPDVVQSVMERRG